MNENLIKIGDFIITPNNEPALEIILDKGSGVKSKLYLMSDKGCSFKICNISGMGEYVHTREIGDDIIKTIYFGLICECLLKLSNMMDMKNDTISRGRSFNDPIEAFLEAVLNGVKR